MDMLAEANFLNRVCLPFLRSAQNEDGGWGFRSGLASRVEATAWVVLALREIESAREMQRAGFRFLRAAQLPDGSWPASATQQEGCWVTSLAAWALLADPDSQKAVATGLEWICGDTPRSTTFLQRTILKISNKKQVSAQDDSLRGWGWTPRTASWVEPTAFALIALDEAPESLVPEAARERRDVAKVLMYDRLCPGGGWNCGNPMVYGVAGDPLIEPTVWALLALRSEPSRRENVLSFEWLTKNLPNSVGTGSVALARVCFRVYEKEWPRDAPSIDHLYDSNEFMGNVTVMAWTCMALSPRIALLQSAAGRA